MVVKFKIGDVVRHKAAKDFTAIIERIEFNCYYYKVLTTNVNCSKVGTLLNFPIPDFNLYFDLVKRTRESPIPWL